MGLRVTGKRALIRITPEGGTAFDASGVSADGRARANAFSFEIGAQIADANAYNQAYTEAVPIGQNAASGSLTVFYNAQNGEANVFFETMRQAQHEPGECTDALKYTMEIMPEGECEGKEKWTLGDVVLTSLEFVTPHDNLMVIQAPWRAWSVERELLALAETCLTAPDGAPVLEIIATYDAQDGLGVGEFIDLYGVTVDGGYAYVPYTKYYGSPYKGGVMRIPVADESGAMLLGALSLGLTFEMNALNPYQCVVSGGQVYVAAEEGLFILDAATMTQVGACTYMEFGWNDPPFLQHAIMSADGNYIFGGGSGFGMAIFDVSDPENPTCVYYDTNHDCEYLLYDAARSRVINVDDAWSYAVYDVTTPTAPTILVDIEDLFRGSNFPSGWALLGDVAAFGEYHAPQKVLLYDVTAATPDLLSTYLHDQDPVYVQLVGAYLIIAAYSATDVLQLTFVDVQTPTAPTYSLTFDVDAFERDGGYNHGFFTVVDDRYVVVNVGRAGFMAVIDCCAPLT